jgi:hypothetical protein
VQLDHRDIAKFYKAFDRDPRALGPFPALLERFQDWDHLPYSVPGASTLAQQERTFAKATAPILALTQNRVVPWFDCFTTLPSIKTALEQHCHNSLKHESLLPIYFLLDDYSGLDEYLRWLLIEIERSNQPRAQDFIPFYEAINARHPKFFPSLDNFKNEVTTNKSDSHCFE